MANMATRAPIPQRVRLAGPYMGNSLGDTSYGTGQVQWNAGSTPALLLTNNFEGGTNTTTITSGNSGGASGNAFNGTVIASGTLAFDNTHAAHGSLSLKTATAGAGDVSEAHWTSSLNSQSKLWFRQYLFLTANGAGTGCRVFTLENSSGSTNCFFVNVSTTGKLLAEDNVNSTLFTFTRSIPLNQWFRIEGWVACSPTAGQGSLSMFYPLDSQVPVETHISAATFNTLDNIGWAAFGLAYSGGAAQGPYWMDDIGVSNTGPLGPVSYPGPPSFGKPIRAIIPARTRGSSGGFTQGTVPKIIYLTNTFDGGTSGTTISAANSGGLSGNAFDSVAVGSGGTAKYSNAVVGGTNLLSGLFQTTTANATAAIWANSMGPQYQIWFRAYLFFATLPTGNSRFFTILNAAGTGCARFYVTTAGAILVQDGAGSTITTSTATIPLNQWFRIEGFTSVSPTHGQTSVSLFTPAGSIVVTETDTSALTQNTLGVATNYAFGPDVAAANQGPFYLDGIGISNTGYLGAIPGNWSPGGFQSFDSISLPSIITTFPSM